MRFIYDFWVEMCPMFSEYEFIYIFLTFMTLYVLLYATIKIPGMIMERSLNIWND